MTAATFCGAVPFLSATAIYATWLVTRWQWLVVAGFILLYVGFVAAVLGIVMLFAHVWRKRSCGATQLKPLRCIVVAAILLVNFPAAVFYARSAVSIFTRYNVTVINASDIPVESFVVLAPGVNLEMGPIEPKGTVKNYHHPQGDGEMTYVLTQGGTEHQGMLEGYVTGNMNGDITVTVRGDGVVEVVNHKFETR